MKKFFRRCLKVIAVILIVWCLLTAWAESRGPASLSKSGPSTAALSALLLYDPDPFYNLDEQVCLAYARGLTENGWKVTIATVAAAENIRDSSFTLYVLCANTYNWAPDRAITGFIQQKNSIRNRSVVAITLGGGSTERSKRIMDDEIRKAGGILVDSKTFWLWRPNDRARLKEPNVPITVDLVKQWSVKLAKTFTK
jgi:hypothetical protein